MSEWIRHQRGPCPVQAGTLLDLKAHGVEWLEQRAKDGDGWHFGVITAYRIVDESIPGADPVTSHSPECVAASVDGRKHVSDAAWQKIMDLLGGTDYYRALWEERFGKLGVMVHSVEEWDNKPGVMKDRESNEWLRAVASMRAERDAALARVKELEAQNLRLLREKEQDCYQLNDIYAELQRLRNPKVDWPRYLTSPKRNALLTVAEPTHLMGGDSAR